MSTKKYIIVTFLLLATCAHALFFYYAIGPLNLYIDSAGYLSFADSFFANGKFLINPNRALGLPFLYFVLLYITQYNFAIIIIIQIFSYIFSLYFFVSSVLSRLNLIYKLLITLIVVYLSTRTFVYSYAILSESLFTSLMLIFIGISFRYFHLRKRQGDTNNKYNQFLLLLLATAVCIAYIKSIGILFILLWFIFAIEVAITKKVLWHAWISLPTLILIFVGNFFIYGTVMFSKQDGIQLLIAANQYINYDTIFMSEDKSLIKESHEMILKIYAPRKRLDQMVGPIEETLTPHQILLDKYQDYNVYSEKVAALVKEGLFVDGDWKYYIVDSAHELKKMIINDTKEGQIIPSQKLAYNSLVADQLKFLGKYISPNNTPTTGAFQYYYFFTTYIFLPKWVMFFVIVLISIFKFYKYRLEWFKTYIMEYLVILASVLFLYISVALVFALDRYYVGIEVVLTVMAIKLLLSNIQKNSPTSFK